MFLWTSSASTALWLRSPTLWNMFSRRYSARGGTGGAALTITSLGLRPRRLFYPFQLLFRSSDLTLSVIGPRKLDCAASYGHRLLANFLSLLPRHRAVSSAGYLFFVCALANFDKSSFHSNRPTPSAKPESTPHYLENIISLRRVFHQLRTSCQRYICLQILSISVQTGRHTLSANEPCHWHRTLIPCAENGPSPHHSATPHCWHTFDVDEISRACPLPCRPSSLIARPIPILWMQFLYALGILRI